MSSPTRCASPLVPELRQEGKRRCSVYHDGGTPRGHGYLTSATAVFNNEENDRKLIIHIVGLLHPRASGLKEPEPGGTGSPGPHLSLFFFFFFSSPLFDGSDRLNYGTRKEGWIVDGVNVAVVFPLSDE